MGNSHGKQLCTLCVCVIVNVMVESGRNNGEMSPFSVTQDNNGESDIIMRRQAPIAFIVLWHQFLVNF